MENVSFELGFECFEGIRLGRKIVLGNTGDENVAGNLFSFYTLSTSLGYTMISSTSYILNIPKFVYTTQYIQLPTDIFTWLLQKTPKCNLFKMKLISIPLPAPLPYCLSQSGALLSIYWLKK